MRLFTVYVSDEFEGRYYRVNLTERQFKRYDNGAMVSCGLSAPDEISRATLARMVKRGRASEVSRLTWNHSGCQSACVTRGASRCAW